MDKEFTLRKSDGTDPTLEAKIMRKSKESNAKRGRPVKLEMPPPIPDTPENVAKAIMQGPPKKVWRYLGNKAR